MEQTRVPDPARNCRPLGAYFRQAAAGEVVTGMRVRVQDQEQGAQLDTDPDSGEPVLSLRTGLVSGAAFAALVVALAQLPDQCYEYLQSAV